MSGVDLDVMHIIAKKYNFNFTTKVEPFMGKRLHSGEWLGNVGAVKNGTSLMGIGNPSYDPGKQHLV